MGFLGGSEGKESAFSAGDPGLIPRLGRSPGEGNGYPLQYSCLGSSMDRAGWEHCIPWGHKASDTTDWLSLSLHFTGRQKSVLWSWWRKLKITQTNGKIIPCCWIWRINIVKMIILPKTIYKLTAAPIKLSMVFFTELEQNFFNLYGYLKDTE